MVKSKPDADPVELVIEALRELRQQQAEKKWQAERQLSQLRSWVHDREQRKIKISETKRLEVDALIYRLGRLQAQYRALDEAVALLRAAQMELVVLIKPPRRRA